MGLFGNEALGELRRRRQNCTVRRDQSSGTSSLLVILRRRYFPSCAELSAPQLAKRRTKVDAAMSAINPTTVAP